MGEPYVKKAGQKKYRQLRDGGATKGDAAAAANAYTPPKPRKKAAKKK